MTGPPSVAIVIPSIGRPSLRQLLTSLQATVPAGTAVLIVNDAPSRPIELSGLEFPALTLRVLRGRGRGPAAARNLGWRAAEADWIVFLDDDVQVGNGWWSALRHDLAGAGANVAAVQGRITVPLPSGRRPTDFERTTAGLQTASWITADLACRRPALVEVDGFDQRFPRAFREDSDLALRLLDAGWQLQRGTRSTLHPVRPADWRISMRQQRGNSDDALMGRLHGRSWRSRAHAPLGRLPQHVVTSAALLGLLSRRTRRPAAALWLVAWAEFAARRIWPGPRAAKEIAVMLVTSAAIPPLACWHRLAGQWRHRHARPGRLPAAVLLDRDGTLVQDVPYNGDPAAVRPVRGAARAMRRLRRAGIPIAIVTNQSGIGRGRLTEAQVRAVNAEIERRLGPFDGWFVCPHLAEDGCDCRKPAPGLVLAAAHALGVPPERCVLIGDIGSDLAAASAAGATGILVPTPVTRAEEIAAAPLACRSLTAAVGLVLTGAVPSGAVPSGAVPSGAVSAGSVSAGSVSNPASNAASKAASNAASNAVGNGAVSGSRTGRTATPA